MKKYFWNIAIMLTQNINTIAGGDPQETTSSRIGKIKAKHNGNIPWTKPHWKLIDWGCEIVDPGHTINSINPDEGDDAAIKE